MQAWILDDAPGTYRLGEIEPPPLGPDDVRVRVVASALNHMDLWVTRGLPKPPLPHIPGCDAAGIVDAVGPGVVSVSAGDEVVVNPAVSCRRCASCLAGNGPYCRSFQIVGEQRWGSHAELVVVPDANVSPRPPARSWEESAAFGLCALTAWRMLRRARLAAGETVLVVGVGGGVSSAALALARVMGARVFATSRDDAKRHRAVALGAEAAFDSAQDFPIKADVVVENVGAATWDRSLRALMPGGRLVTCGGTAGSVVELQLPRLFFKQFEIIGSTMGSYDEWHQVTALVDAGLPVEVDHIFEGLDAYPEALARLEAGTQLGKLVIRH
ncbi:MAG: zinc-binding dehydrogenase [Acidimicrobiales bacterium]